MADSGVKFTPQVHGRGGRLGDADGACVDQQLQRRCRGGSRRRVVDASIPTGPRDHALDVKPAAPRGMSTSSFPSVCDGETHLHACRQLLCAPWCGTNDTCSILILAKTAASRTVGIGAQATLHDRANHEQTARSKVRGSASQGTYTSDTANVRPSSSGRAPPFVTSAPLLSGGSSSMTSAGGAPFTGISTTLPAWALLR